MYSRSDLFVQFSKLEPVPGDDARRMENLSTRSVLIFQIDDFLVVDSHITALLNQEDDARFWHVEKGASGKQLDFVVKSGGKLVALKRNLHVMPHGIRWQCLEGIA